MRLLLFCALIFWSVSGAASLAQQPTAPVYTEVSGEQLATILTDEGYRAKVSEDDYGDPVIESSVGGTSFRIIFYNCDLGSEGFCEDVMFRVAYSLPSGIDLETINAWNEDKRFSRAWRDDEDDPILEQDLDFAGGITRERVVTSLSVWESSVGLFEDHIDW
ncbi:YbjN domain-containing protein [Algihabitans albus]|uniref:YbjN domain-containing protein n=1 Tax=Algihabitans albus TaxID=2164067 RepID=UPI000E5CD751|nr:YbjN domain-containing protein [Algihabitans albus]